MSRGLVGCWPLGDVGGTGARLTKDISPNVSNGTLNNGPTLANSHHGGNSLAFTSGSTTFVDLGAPNPLEFSATARFTIACWVQSASNPGGQEFAVGKDFSTGSRGYGLGISTAGQLYLESGGQVAFSGTGPVFGNTNTWTFLCGVQSGDANQNWTAYVNGASIGTLNSSFTYAANSAAHWYIGGRSYVGFFNGLTGNIEGVRVYSRGLSASEIARLYAEPYAGIVSSWPAYRVGAAAVGGSTLSYYYYDQHVARSA